MDHSKIGDLLLRLKTEEEISSSERIRRGVKYSPPKRPSSEALEYEGLRDQVLATRIKRAAKAEGIPD